MKNTLVVTGVIVVLVFGAGGFFGGIKYQQNKRVQFTGQFSARQNGQPNRGNVRPVAGEISTADDTSITVKLADGSNKIILISEKTTINKATEGTKTDLTTGTTVMIFGTENTDGSVTAQNIQLGAYKR